MLEISRGLARGLDGFLDISPGVGQCLKLKWLKRAWRLRALVKQTIPVIKGEQELSVALGKFAGSRIKRNILRPVTRGITRSHMKAQIKRNTTKHGIGGRTWINPLTDADRNGRIVKNMIIIYHDANKAQRHLDIHIGHLSFIMRVSGKPVEDKIKFNNKGELTQDAKDALLNHVRQEIFSHSRVPQNLDHSISNAKCTWNVGDVGLRGYGAGLTRQIVSSSKVEFYHTHLTSSLHMYAPIITPHQGLYLYKIYDGKTTGVPIAIWGVLNPRDDKFKDRLHLKMIQEEDFEKFKSKTDKTTVSRKYDGASTHFGTTGQGFKFFSPRYSKATGHRIEYTYKLAELAERGFGPVKPDRTSHTQGMGEILFYRKNLLGDALEYLFNWKGLENISWCYLNASEIGGILNSHRVRPRDVFPEVRIYRVDKFEGQDTYLLPFHQNRELQKEIAKVNRYFKVVALTTPKINRNKDYEGYVAVPIGLSINEGLKYKFKGDEIDMTIKSIDLYLSEKQNIAGTILCTYNGKEYRFGPGSIGDVKTCLDFMNNKQEFTGRTIKTVGFRGHVGRAAKILSVHLDK